MKREVHIAFADIKERVDPCFFDNDKVSVDYLFKGQLRSNGRTKQPFDSVDIYLNHTPPDEYDLRIDALITALGGVEAVSKLVTRYQARYSDIILSIPSISSETIEDGFISYEMMKKLYDLRLGIQFHYT